MSTEPKILPFKPKPPAHKPDEPTRRSAEALLRERVSSSSWDDREYREMERRLEERAKELMTKDPVYQRLSKTLKARHRKLTEGGARASKLKEQTRRLFQAEGLTKRVKRLLVELAETLNARDE